MANRTSPQESDLPEKLASPALRALAAAGIQRLDQVATYSESQLKRLHGMGPKAIEQLREAMEGRGLSFAEEPKPEPLEDEEQE